jgi:hypothetical protein
METKTHHTEEKKLSPADTQKGIDNHKKAAKHHEEAAKHHLEAVKHHEAGNYDKACTSAIKAHGHHCNANEAQREVSKIHANSN